MIFVAAGTQDGRELTKLLLDAGHRVTASVVSHYGEQLLKRCGSERLTINDKPLDCEALESYLREHRASCFVDASHPYAVNVSENAMAACHPVSALRAVADRARGYVAFGDMPRSLVRGGG